MRIRGLLEASTSARSLSNGCTGCAVILDDPPRLAEIESDLSHIAGLLADLGDTGGNPTAISQLIASVAARIGELQVQCCAPARMPLHAETLGGLNEVQLVLNRHVDS